MLVAYAARIVAVVVAAAVVRIAVAVVAERTEAAAKTYWDRP